MLFLKLTTLWLLSLYNRPVLSGSVNCNGGVISAPFDDCKEVVRRMDEQWRQHGMNLPKVWGRDFMTNDTHIQIPISFFLKPTGHTKRTINCEFYVNTLKDRPHDADTFNYQKLALASNRVLEECYPQLRTGYAFPSVEEHVYTTPRYRAWSDMLTGTEVGEFDGYMLMTAEEPIYPDVLLDTTLTS